MYSRKEQIITLWKTVFNDSDEFVRLYFGQVYKDGNAFVIEKNGHIVSALQMLPYRMFFCGEDLPVGYISGACTLPSERGKGWMSELLHNASEEMKNRNIPIAALIPAEAWLFDYYRSRGYTEAFRYATCVYIRSKHAVAPAAPLVVRQEREPRQIFYDYFDRKLRERPACMLHTYEDFAVILEDTSLSGGSFFVASNPDGLPAGMAFVSRPERDDNTGERSVLIKEILYDSEQIKQDICHAVTQRLEIDKALCRIPPAARLQTHPYGMAQLINPERIIDLWMSTHPGSKLSATDMRSMDRQLLTRRLLASPEQTSYMSLMLD